jgi:hypothetical protein
LNLLRPELLSLQWIADLPRREHRLPVLLHIHNNPAHGISPVEGLVQRADVAFAVVGIFAIRVSVVNE